MFLKNTTLILKTYGILKTQGAIFQMKKTSMSFLDKKKHFS